MFLNKKIFVDGLSRAKKGFIRFVAMLTRKSFYKQCGKRFGFFIKKYAAFILIFALFILIAFWLFSLNQKMDKIIDKIGGKTALECIEHRSVEKAQKSTVMIIGGEAEGSGFFIWPGYIITNFHVIEFEPSPKVIFIDKSFSVGEVVTADQDADLAIVKVSRDNIKPLEFNENVELFSSLPIIAVGFPYGGSLPVGSSVIKGSLSTLREEGELIQLDKELIPGMSGGPMITECGEVIGINSMSMSGIGFAISVKKIKSVLENFLENGSPDLAKIQQIEFKPNEGPVETVKAFYNYIKIRKLDKAFELMSDYLKGGLTFEEFKNGYENQLDTTIFEIELMPGRKNVVSIVLGSKDLIDDEIVYRYFQGRWQVKKIDGKWQLWSSFIKEIDPDTGEWIES